MWETDCPSLSLLYVLAYNLLMNLKFYNFWIIEMERKANDQSKPMQYSVQESEKYCKKLHPRLLLLYRCLAAQ